MPSFVPFHAMGMVGMPRRYAQFGEYEFLKNTHGLVLFLTVAAIITAVVQLVFYFNFFWSMFKGKKPATIPGRPRRWKEHSVAAAA